MGRAVAAVRQRTLGSQPQLGDHVQALWTGYKPVTKPDQQLLDRCVMTAWLLPFARHAAEECRRISPRNQILVPHAHGQLPLLALLRQE